MIKIIFLDRDGVINEFPGMGNYVTSWSQFRFIPKSIEAITFLTREGYEIHVVSNQGSVSRGLITREGLDQITRRMADQIEKAGGKISGVHYCIHQTSDNCECKKPKTLLFKQALDARKVSMDETYFIGDSQEDVEASRALGCQSVLVLSGRLGKADLGRLNPAPDHVKENLWEAAHWITGKS